MYLSLFVAAIVVLVVYLYMELALGRGGPAADAPPPDLDRRILAKYEQMQELSTRLTSGITVRDIMTAPPEMVPAKASIVVVRSMMNILRVHHCFVKNKHGRLVGVISDRDLAQRRGFRAGHIMTRNPIYVRPDCTPMRAVGLMISKRISCLPVIDGCRLCGVVTTTDLLLTLEALLKIVSEQRQDGLAVTADSATFDTADCTT